MLNTYFDFCIDEYQWLDSFIYNELGAQYNARPKAVMLNLENDEEDNKNYLGTYFPRTCAEYFSIMGNLSQHGKIREKLQNCSSLDILTVGSGTGGEIVGIVLYLAKLRNSNMPKLRISYVEGNRHASQLFKKVMAELADHYDIYIELRGLNQVVRSEYPSYGHLQFDLIVTSKFINELVNRYPQKKWYGDFLKSYADNLAKDGLMIVSDITCPIHENEYDFVPLIMNEEIRQFLKKNEDFDAILPVPCREYGRKCNCECFSQSIVDFHTSKSFNYMGEAVVSSKFTYNVIARTNLSETLSDVPKAVYGIKPKGVCEMTKNIGGDAINGFDIASVAV